MLKECKFKLIPSDNGKLIVGKSLMLSKDKKEIRLYLGDLHDYSNCEHSHLYIISDEEPQEGDLCIIGGIRNSVGKYYFDDEYNTHDITTDKNIHYPFTSKEYFSKVIAINDNSRYFTDQNILNHNTYEQDVLPEIFTNDIESFIEFYNENKGAIPNKLFVQYDLLYLNGHQWNPFPDHNPKKENEKKYILYRTVDNKIRFDLPQNNFSRKELIDILNKFAYDFSGNGMLVDHNLEVMKYYTDKI